jgi:GT2 family glycosyltransferase
MREQAAHDQRELMLLFVAFHPSSQEVERLQACLASLPACIGYGVVVNDHRPGEPIDKLASHADHFLACLDNPGYGEAVNRIVAQLRPGLLYLAVMNTDLTWDDDCFPGLLTWLCDHPDVTLAVPQIRDGEDRIQKLCKRDPTLLGLLSRRFIPGWLKPAWLRRYDQWYVMADHDYTGIFDVPYLSGCCMLIRADAFVAVKGFDARFFLYLEDADITRKLRQIGRCVHLPVRFIRHDWGRGNYRNPWLVLVNLHSAWIYFNKWGWRLW